MKYFVFGFILDILITVHTIKIVGKKPLVAGLVSGIITFINLFVYGMIIIEGLSILSCLYFTAGCVLGTIFATKYIRK